MSAIRAPDGAVSWPSVATDSVALTGFSHGAAGTGLACLKLGQLLGESQVSALWDAARIFESLHFLESEGNWADLRPKDLETDGTASRSNISAWCNGAVGIGLARCLAILWNPHQGSGVGILDEIGVALRTAKLTGCGYSQSLCHGDLGTMEFHLAASRLEKFASESTFALGIAKMVCDSVNNGSWSCGVPPGINVPGLMTGLAGIGYGLLRIAAPKAANVLCLEL
jgi:lantibiotic modifying enzyme